MLRIGINGFGRIGRTLTRIIANRNDIELVVVNDLDPLLHNHVYLLKFDSIYGKYEGIVEINDEHHLSIGDRVVRFYSSGSIADVPWSKYEVDAVIDASGVEDNAVDANKLLSRGVRKVLVTHSTKSADLTVVMGVCEDIFSSQKHGVISTSICDATAVAPVLHALDKKYKISNCFFTTLHPWLSYQNLLDGSLRSVSSPGHYWTDFSLGRSSVGNLIPKNTTAAMAVVDVLPRLAGRVDAISYRVPTSIVASSDITVILRDDVSEKDINEMFADLSRQYPGVYGFVESNEHRVSLDFLRSECSTHVDSRWTRVLDKRIAKLVIWYDNEWGYSSKVIDILNYVSHSQGMIG